MKTQKRIALKTLAPIASLAPIALIFVLIFNGCGGGGGGSTPNPQSAIQNPQSPAPTATIGGKVVINGVNDYTGVMVVAEKSEGGVTARVQRMLDTAKEEGKDQDQDQNLDAKDATGANDASVAARVALDTPGVYTTQTDSAGNYEFKNIPEGKYSISAYKESTLAATPRIVEATAGQAVTVNFELVATGSVSGAISFGAASNAVVMAYLEGTSYSGYVDRNTNVFTITNVPVGTYTIVFTQRGEIVTSHSGVVVTAGQTTNDATTSYVVACNDNSNCDDGNNYTLDVCNNSGTEQAVCTHATVACYSEADCNDDNTHTVDICTNAGTASSACLHDGIPCLSDAECNDNNPATSDKCNNPGTPYSACSNAACYSNADCNDGNAYTQDTCNNPAAVNASCVHAAIVCLTNADCNDSNAGTIDQCSNPGTTSSSCTNTVCFADTDCNDGNTHTQDTCASAGTPTSACNHTAIVCLNDAECDDSNASTIDLCNNAGTVSSACSNSVCFADTDCNDANTHTQDTCANAGTVTAACGHTAIACLDDTECNDNDDYTFDSCANAGTTSSVCNHTAIACLTNTDCDDADAYTQDTCANAGTTSSACNHAAIACLSDVDCDDANVGTIDTCNNPNTVSASCAYVDPAPTATTLSAPSSVTTTTLTLTWTQSAAADFESYRIYRSTTSNVTQASTLVESITNVATVSTSVTGLINNTRYYFKVYVCDLAAQCTASNEVNAKTLIQGTYVTSHILVDTTWTLANSPYVITSLIQVASGATLTMEPGVTVMYENSSAKLQILGAIIANGTAIDNITFTSTTEGVNSGATMIEIYSTANLSLSQISYIIAKWGATGLSINSNIGSLTVSNSTFANNSASGSAPGGIYNNSGSLAVINSAFEDNYAPGGYSSSGIYNNSGSLTVSNSTFTNNTGSGYSGGIYNNSGSLMVSNSMFTNNSATIAGGIYNNIGSLTVSNSTFTNNSANYIYGIGGVIHGPGAISYSTISSTTGLAGPAVVGLTSLTYSVITGYTTGVEGMPTTFHHNNIHDNSQYNFKVSGSSGVTIANNWWGTTDTAAIDAKIFDYNDNLLYGLVTYTPILNAPEPTAGDPD